MNESILESERSKKSTMLAEEYTQTYLIKTTGNIDADEDGAFTFRDIFFRCGNWCYTGQVKISYQHAFEMSMKGSWK